VRSRLAVLVVVLAAACSTTTSVRSGDDSTTTAGDQGADREAILQAFDAWEPPDQSGVRYEVDSIEFVGDSRAWVDLRPDDGEGDVVPGGAVKDQNGWRVTHATDCYFENQLRDACPPGEFLTDEERRIGKPFADLARSDMSDEERLANLEDGERIREYFLDIVERHRGALGAPLRVLAVRHRPGAKQAQVWFTQSTIGPGLAVLEDGRWKVSQSSWCQLTFNYTRESCPKG